MDWTLLGQQIYYGLMNGAIYVTFAAGLTLIFGVMQVFNMAHGEVAMLASMVLYSIVSYAGVPFFAAAAISLIAMGITGYLLNRLAVQPYVGTSRLIVILSTLAVSYVMLHGAVAVWGSSPLKVDAPFTRVFHGGGVAISSQSLTIFVVGGLIILLVYLILNATRLGKMMRATAQNLTGAQLVGINIQWIYNSTVIIASVLGGLAGMLYFLITSAHPAMGQPLLLIGFAVVIVAGMGNLPGAVALGLFLGVAEALFGQYYETYFRSAFIYAIMIVVLLFRPQGLFGRK